MKIEIIAWKNHHFPWDGKTIRNLNDLYSLICNGFIWHEETTRHDEKIKITIETED
jgi:hypothetical protein